MKFKGAIFDMDGTLIDSMYIWNDLGEKYLNTKGITPDKDINDKIKNMTLLQAVNYFKEKYELNDSTIQILKEINHMIRKYYNETFQQKDGVLQFLNFLKKENIIMYIATATDEEPAVSALTRIDIMKYFKGIRTCEQVGFGKDRADIFIQSAANINITPKDIIVFEDSLCALQTAKKAGFITCGIYDEYADNDWININKTADYSFKDFNEALKFFSEEI